MADTEARWYCLNALGQATLCRDEADALDCAKESDATWPRNAPSRAVLLGPVAELLAERDRLRADVRELMEFVRICKEREWHWLPKDLAAQARALLAKHALHALADNAREMGLSYDDPNDQVKPARRAGSA